MTNLEYELIPLEAPFGAECRGLDLRQPLSTKVKKDLASAWRAYSLLLFRDQTLNETEQARVASIFGVVEIDETTSGQGIMYLSSYVEGSDIGIDLGDQDTGVTSEEGHGFVSRGELSFHFDGSFDDQPHSGLMLYAIEVPPPGAGGETLFSSGVSAYESLPSDLRRRVDALTVRHGFPDLRHWVGRPPTVPDGPHADHPLAMQLPGTDRTFLFMSYRHAERIVELPQSESDALLDELATYIGRSDNIYSHSWRVGDLVVWDNLALQHARTDFDADRYRRSLRRLEIA